MKKRIFITAALALLAALLVVGGITLAKYISTLRDETSTFTSSPFYFRSNVMTDEADPATVTVSGGTTTLLLVNSADSSTHTAEDITYVINYYALVGGEWVPVNTVTPDAPLTGGIHSSVSITVTPLYYDADTDGTPERYDDVMVEAVASMPYKKTLRAKLHFDYTDYTVSYDVDYDMAIITLKITTNDDAGVFNIGWSRYLLPDNADPNGILTAAATGPSSVTPTLAAHTTYPLYFFVKTELLDEMEAELGALSFEEQMAALFACEKQ